MIAQSSTIPDVLRYRAAHQSAQQAYSFLTDGESQEDSVTYAELDRRARAVGAWLQAAGAVGERVLLLLPAGLEYIAAFFGCLYAGAVAVPAYPPRPNEKSERLRAIADDAEAKFGITTAATLKRLESPAQPRKLPAFRWLVTDRIAAELEEWAAAWNEPRLHRDSLAFIQYTSGSTAEPKGVMVSHGNLSDNSAIIHRRFEHGPDSRGVIWLPLYHDMGLIGGVIQPLYGGFPVTLMSPVSFLLRPFRWLQAISRTGATTSGGPNFAYDLCVRKISREQCSGLDLSRWKVAFNGSERVRRDTLERFAGAFADCGFRREAFYPCYGLAEATLFVAGGRETTSAKNRTVTPSRRPTDTLLSAGNDTASDLVACGRAAPDLEVVVVDPERLTRRGSDEVGEIWISGASVALGYWNRPEETDATFRARIPGTGEGPFLRTGDLGCFVEGELMIAGRLKDLIILAGRNHHPEDIERTIEEAHAALQPGSCAAFSVDCGGEEGLMLVVEVDSRRLKAAAIGSADLIRAIRRSVAEHHDARVQRVLLVRPGVIPRTTSGKIRRAACRAWVAENDRVEKAAAES